LNGWFRVAVTLLLGSQDTEIHLSKQREGRVKTCCFY